MALPPDRPKVDPLAKVGQTMFESREILLVEDNPMSLELTLHALKSSHLLKQIHVVSDGAQALDYVFRRGQYADRNPNDPPVLVLLDLKLPHVAGLEILRQLRAEPSTHLIPVVIFSRSDNERDIAESYALGANGYVVKPVEYDKFSRVIGEVARYWLALNVPPSA